MSLEINNFKFQDPNSKKARDGNEI